MCRGDDDRDYDCDYDCDYDGTPQHCFPQKHDWSTANQELWRLRITAGTAGSRVRNPSLPTHLEAAILAVQQTEPGTKRRSGRESDGVA